MIPDTVRALVDVANERVRQVRLWGEQYHDPWAWYSILGEEVGEVGRELSDALGGLPHGDSKYPRRGSLNVAKYRMELVHVAAVAVAAIETLDGRQLVFEHHVDVNDDPFLTKLP